MNRSRRILVALALAACSFAITGTIDAQYYCAEYWDSRSGSSGGTTFCWLSGSICYDCWDDSYNTCSSDWQACDPRPRGPFQQYADQLTPLRDAAASPAQSVQICAVTESDYSVRVEILF